jgi:hypothetical protein
VTYQTTKSRGCHQSSAALTRYHCGQNRWVEANLTRQHAQRKQLRSVCGRSIITVTENQCINGFKLFRPMSVAMRLLTQHKGLVTFARISGRQSGSMPREPARHRQSPLLKTQGRKSFLRLLCIRARQVDEDASNKQVTLAPDSSAMTKPLKSAIGVIVKVILGFPSPVLLARFTIHGTWVRVV